MHKLNSILNLNNKIIAQIELNLKFKQQTTKYLAQIKLNLNLDTFRKYLTQIILNLKLKIFSKIKLNLKLKLFCKIFAQIKPNLPPAEYINVKSAPIAIVFNTKFEFQSVKYLAMEQIRLWFEEIE